MDFELGQQFAGEYPPEVASWCDAHGCYLAMDESGEEVVYTIEESHLPGPVFAPPTPTASDLADAIAEIGDMVASQDATNEMILDALAELGDAVAALEERGA